MQVNVSGIDNVVKSIDELISDVKNIDSKIDKIVDNSKNIASNIFLTAPNTSNATTTVDVDKGNHRWTIIASGTDVLFIEFGTGITYPDIHPLASKMGYTRGDYGILQGRFSTWYFRTKESIRGAYVTAGDTDSYGTIYSTHGQPASMPMYKALQNIETELKGIAK